MVSEVGYASSHHILANSDEDQKNSDERHHADSDVEMYDAKPLEDSQRCSFYLVP